MNLSESEILGILSLVKDPEIPTVDIVGLGIVRAVKIEHEQLRVDITPTYSGCPAMLEIEREIVQTLQEHGYSDVKVNTVYAPPWTTDWITPQARQQLKDAGITPPDKLDRSELVNLTASQKSIQCPFCDSEQTELRSEYGPTACKSLHYCNGCQQPFERFKVI